MIALTRLNGSSLYINAELIETVEANPDTVIKLVNGKKYVVLEDPEEIRKRVLEYRREILSAVFQKGDTT